MTMALHYNLKMFLSIFFLIIKIDFLNNGNNRFKSILKLIINIYNKFIAIITKKFRYIIATKNNT